MSTINILHSIAKAHSSAFDEVLSRQESKKLSDAVKRELGIGVTPEELTSASLSSAIAALVESQLPTNRSGRTLLTIYEDLEKIAREEYHPAIPYEWVARWDDFLKVGNWLTKPEGLDAVEMVIRIEHEYGLKISDQDAAEMQRVGDTVRYLWKQTDSAHLKSD